MDRPCKQSVNVHERRVRKLWHDIRMVGAICALLLSEMRTSMGNFFDCMAAFVVGQIGRNFPRICQKSSNTWAWLLNGALDQFAVQSAGICTHGFRLFHQNISLTEELLLVLKP